MEADTSAPEFEVNEYIMLRLEDGTTNIYVNGKLFRACKAFVFQTDTESARELDDIDSIDDLIDRTYDLRLDIDPETEFWGHCSNLHAWAEHDYDTRLLDMRLAFPILRLMAKAGNARARVRFEEEVIMRYNEGSEHVRTAMMAMGLLHELSGYDYLYGLIEEEQADYLVSMLARFEFEIDVQDFIPRFGCKPGKVYVELKDRNIRRISIPISDKCPTIPWELSKFPELIGISIQLYELSKNTLFLEKKDVCFLKVGGVSINPRGENNNKEIIIDFFSGFPYMKSFAIAGFQDYHSRIVFQLSESLLLCKNIEGLKFQFCNLREIPSFLSELKYLKRLIIRHVEIKSGGLPLNILGKGDFEVIQLQSSQIPSIPEKLIIKNINLRYFVSHPDLITDKMRSWFEQQNFFKTKSGYLKEDGIDPKKVERWAKIPIMWDYGF